MMISTQEFEQLRLLYKGSLSNQEAASFKQKTVEDASFRAEAIELLHLIHQIKKADKSRQTIKAILAQNDSAQVRPPALKYALLIRWSWAITIVAGISFSVWYLSIDRAPFTLSLTEEPNIISHNKRGESELSIAESKFDQEKYKAAALHFYKAFQQNPENLELLYNYAVASYKSKNWEEAQNTFYTLSQSSSFEKHQKAELYWALSLIRAKKRAKGERILRDIAQNEVHPQQALAKKILSQLKKN